MTALQARLLEALRSENIRLGLPANVWGRNNLQEAAYRNAITKTGERALEASTNQSIESIRTLPRYAVSSANIVNKDLLRFNANGSREAAWGNDGRVELKLAKNVTVHNWNDFHIVNQVGLIVPDASSSAWPLFLSGIQGIDTFLVTQDELITVDTAFMMASDLPPGNFCHFLADALPKLSFADDLMIKPTIISPIMVGHAYEKQAIELISKTKGYRFLTLDPGSRISVANLYYLSHPGDIHPFFACSGWSIDWLRSLYHGTVCNNGATSIRDYLVIGRSRRKILNEIDVVERLSRLGSLTYIPDLGSLDLLEQIRLFRSHRHIIAPHGAALTLLAFKHDYPISCTEVFAEGNGMATFARISHKYNIQHNIYATSRVESEHPNYPDMKPDARELVSLIHSGGI